MRGLGRGWGRRAEDPAASQPSPSAPKDTTSPGPSARFVADGSDRLRRALAALPEEERLATQERLAVWKRRAPGTDERQTPHRWRGRLAAALARLRERASEDGNPSCPECLWSSHRHAGGVGR